MKERGAYLLPDPLQPEDYYVFCVYVPKSFDHLLAFWGSLDYLAKWVAWQPNEAHDARLAASAWLAANTLTRASFEAGENCEGGGEETLYDTRVKPGFWWQQQASTDGGITWHDSLIQPLPCDCEGVQGSGGGTGGDFGNPPIPDAGDIAADILRGWTIFWTNQIRDAILDGRTREEFEGIASAILGPGANAEVIDALGDAFDAASATDPDVLTAMATSECEWSQAHHCMYEIIVATGSNYLDELGEILICALNGMSDGLIEALNTAAEAMGAELPDFFHEKAGGGGGAGFGASGGCDWIVVSLGTLLDTVFPQAFPECSAFIVDIPAGYRLAGVYWEYSSTGNDSATSPKVYPGIDPNCGPQAGFIHAWQNTTAWFGASYAKAIMRLMPLTNAEVFEDNGFDLSGLQPTGNYLPNYTPANHLGPGTFKLPISWRPTTTVGVSAGITGWAILQSYP